MQQQTNNKDIHSGLKIETLIFSSPTRQATNGKIVIQGTINDFSC